MAEVNDAVEAVSANQDQIMMALIALVATSVAALVYVIRNGRYVKTAAEQSTEANAAVNNVGPGKHTLYVMVEQIKEDVAHLKRDQEQFDSHGWETLPADMNTAVGLTTTIRELQRHAKDVNGKLDVIINHIKGVEP